MPIRSRIPHATAAILAVALLAGCSSSAESAAPGPTETLPSSSPTLSTSASTATPSDDLFDVAPGELLADALDRTGAALVEGCAGVATSEMQGYRLQIQTTDDQADPYSEVALVALTAPVGTAAQGPVGPRTAEGIGIGSTVDEARTAYPDAREITGTEGPQRYLQAATGDPAAPLFFAYSEGTPFVWGVISTDQEVPELAPCA